MGTTHIPGAYVKMEGWKCYNSGEQFYESEDEEIELNTWKQTNKKSSLKQRLIQIKLLYLQYIDKYAP